MKVTLIWRCHGFTLKLVNTWSIICGLCLFKCFLSNPDSSVVCWPEALFTLFSVVSLNCAYLEQEFQRDFHTTWVIQFPPHPSLHPVSHYIYHAPANSIILAGMNTMLYFIPTIHLDNPYTNSFVLLTIRQSKTVRSWILKQCVGLSKPRPQQ